VNSAGPRNLATCRLASFLAALLMPEVLFVKEFYPQPERIDTFAQTGF
jgi:hypothetical protein